MSKVKTELKGVAIPSVNESNTKVKQTPAKMRQKPNSGGSIKTAPEFSCYVRLEDIVLSLDLNSCKRLHFDADSLHIVATKIGSNKFSLSAFNSDLSKFIKYFADDTALNDDVSLLTSSELHKDLSVRLELSLSDVREVIEHAINRQLKARNIELH